jgi:hypothetical protein
VFFIARKEGVHKTRALVASALYFASFRVLDAYTLCALPDSLYSFLIVAGYCAFAYGKTTRTEALWLVLFALAFWTKQHGAFFFGFAMMYAVLGRPRLLPRWVYPVVYVITVPIAFAVLGPLLGEGFFRHALDIPSHWQRSLSASIFRTAYVILALVPFSVALTVLYLRTKWTLRIRELPPLLWFMGTGMVSVIISMTATGASNNHYMPLLTVLCATTVVGASQVRITEPSRLHMLVLLSGGVLVGSITALLGREHGLTQWYMPLAASILIPVIYLLRKPPVAALLLFGQFACALYLPSVYLPDPSYRVAQNDLKTLVSAVDGNVILASFGYAPKDLTGVRTLPTPSWVAIDDVVRQVGVPEEKRSVKFLRAYIDANPTVRILSAAPLSYVEGWDQVAADFDLEHDYQNTFAALRQVPAHWYGAGGSPRYLYRRRQQPNYTPVPH